MLLVRFPSLPQSLRRLPLFPLFSLVSPPPTSLQSHYERRQKNNFSCTATFLVSSHTHNFMSSSKHSFMSSPQAQEIMWPARVINNFCKVWTGTQSFKHLGKNLFVCSFLMMLCLNYLPCHTENFLTINDLFSWHKAILKKRNRHKFYCKILPLPLPIPPHQDHGDIHLTYTEMPIAMGV